MASLKAGRFERYRKEAERKTILYISTLTIIVGGLTLIATGHLIDFLLLMAYSPPVVLFSGLLCVVLIALWEMPIFHYREESETDLEEETENKINLEEDGVVEELEQKGWEVQEREEKKLSMTVYPSLFHRILRKKLKMTVERVGEGEGRDILLLKRNGINLARIQYLQTSESQKTVLKESTVSTARVTPIYLELLIMGSDQSRTDIGLTKYSIWD
ncbi:MAG: hypothetical protein ABEJ93_01205 [Candidatus Nanohalobium sp.]